MLLDWWSDSPYSMYVLLTLEHLHSQVYRWIYDILVPLSFISFPLTFVTHLQPFCLLYFDYSIYCPPLLLRVSSLFVLPKLSASNLSWKKKPTISSPSFTFSSLTVFVLLLRLSVLWVTPQLQLSSIFFCVQSHSLWMRGITWMGFEGTKEKKELRETIWALFCVYGGSVISIPVAPSSAVTGRSHMGAVV